MTLQELAQNTIDLEYPGRDLETAKNEANLRALEMLEVIGALEEQLQRTQYQLDNAIQNYHAADQACIIFENAINETEETLEEIK